MGSTFAASGRVLGLGQCGRQERKGQDRSVLPIGHPALRASGATACTRVEDGSPLRLLWVLTLNPKAWSSFGFSALSNSYKWRTWQ